MEETPRSSQSQHIIGDFTANVQGEGNATVNVTLPPLTKQWLKPARPTLSKPFVGRQALVDTLLADLTSGKHVNITGRAFQGMGGIGKTYLAVKLAMALYDSFPGGAIRIDVGPQVTDEASAQLPLSRLASYAFGGIPPLGQFQPEQVAAWLNETAPGPFLVIFDDLWHPTPLRFLTRALPPHVVQLVTTRFANIAQTIGATIVPLERLSLADGFALLEERLHCQNDRTHRPTLEALVRLLGGHALALEIAAAQIKKLSRLQTVYSELVHGIGQGTLTSLKLSPGEERDENLERSFALSYERLTPEQQRLFRLLGVFAEESLITADAAAAIWGLDKENAAQNKLFELADSAILTEIEGTTEIEDTTTGSTSFRQHGLLRVYAQALLETANELPRISRMHAQYYTDLSWQATTKTPWDSMLLDQQTPNLLVALQWTEHNDPSLFSSLTSALSDFLFVRGQIALLETYLPKAITTAALTENKIYEAKLLVSLGVLEERLGNVAQARTHFETALPLYRTERSRVGEADVLKSLGVLEARLGNVAQARTHYETALPLYRIERSRVGEANVLKSLGDMFLACEEWTEAKTSYEKALPLYTIEFEPLGLAYTLIDLGRARFELGDQEQAIQDEQRAAELFHRLKDSARAERAEQYLAEMRLKLKQQ